MIGTSALKNIIDNLPHAIGYKNKDSVFTYANFEYAQIVGLKCATDVTGRTAYDMPGRTSECAQLFHEQDEKVMHTQKPLSIFGIHPREQGDFRAYKFIKSPLRDDLRNVVGTFFTGEEITNRTTYELSKFIKNIPIKVNGKLLLENGSYLVGTEHTGLKINNRGHEVLFYFLHGRKTNFIANVLGITARTVYKHMAEIKKEFNVLTTLELKDKAIGMGLLQVLPLAVFDEQISMALNKK